MKKVLLFALVSVCCFSCFEAEESIALEDLHGYWNGIGYEIGDKPQSNASDWQFQINPDSTYLLKYGSNAQEGIYRVAGNKLYTTPKGEAEISVAIEQLTQDSMVIKMNRSGIIEILTFGRSF